jgi:predicted metal-dependent hydrolase
MPSERAKSEFKARVYAWAEKLEVEVRSITVRSMSRKWASCSTNGNLTFDTKLLDLSSDLQDYVIVHELLHFHVPNHGKLWKSLMRAHLGEYETVETRLSNYGAGNPASAGSAG